MRRRLGKFEPIGCRARTSPKGRINSVTNWVVAALPTHRQLVRSNTMNTNNGYRFTSRRAFKWGMGTAALFGLALLSIWPGASAMARESSRKIFAGKSYHNDVSPALRDLPPWIGSDTKDEYEGNLNPVLPNHHADKPDRVVQNGFWLNTLAPSIPAPILNFDGIPFPGVGCSCSPPDTNGVIGSTQYVQMVNEGFQVFDKTTGASVMGPTTASSPSGPGLAESARPMATVTPWFFTITWRIAG